MSEFEVLIAAGGQASRAPIWNRPKSLIEMRGIPLLEATLRSTLDAGYTSILVTTDRPDHEMDDAVGYRAIFNRVEAGWSAIEFDEELVYRVVRKRPRAEVELHFDDGYPSTFALNQALAERMTSKYLFLYGHAPRLPEELKHFQQTGDAQMCGRFWDSFRRDPFTLGDPRFPIEPPFVLNREKVLGSIATSWREYFSGLSEPPETVLFPSPSEPNTPEEILAYAKYYADMLHGLPHGAMEGFIGIRAGMGRKRMGSIPRRLRWLFR